MYAGSLLSSMPCRLRNGIVALLLGFAFGGNAAWCAETIDYTVSVTGVKSSGLKDSIVEASQLLDKSRRPVPTLRALRRRVEESLPRITALLRARAYYAATHDFRIDRKSDKEEEVILEIKLGPVYRIGSYDIRPVASGGSLPTIDIPLKTLGLKLGERAKSELITDADNLLLAALGKQGYPLARIVDRRIVVDHKARTLSATISVETGPHARFGQTVTEGLKDVDQALVTRNVTWVRGAPFDSSLLEDLRSKLRQTGLFTSVLVRHAEKVDDRGEMDVTISVKERKHRSIGAGASFSTTEGPLGKLFWEHRNLWGQGERLNLRGELGQIRQGAFGDLRLTDVGARDQDLVFDARATREKPDEFTSIETAATARLERRFAKFYSGSAGLGFDRSNVDENGIDRNFTFLTFPLSLNRDTSDDLLDASTGGRTSLNFTPNIGIVGTSVSFYAAQLFDTVYFPLMAEKKLVLAGWGRIGTIFGEPTLNIPANKRLYAGGPGSVRGYARHGIGPLDVENDPIGGRSSTEVGIELRWRVYGPFGVVSFLEGGGVYDSTMPDWGRHLQWGAGAGARYLTKIGPLRLDVAVPLNRRNSVDDAFQILVSLGQAF